MSHEPDFGELTDTLRLLAEQEHYLLDLIEECMQPQHYDPQTVRKAEADLEICQVEMADVEFQLNRLTRSSTCHT